MSKLLQSGLIQGKNPRVLARDLRKVFQVSTFNAERLMRTELARVQTDAQKQSFERGGFDEYEFIVNGGCCEICEGLKGKHFKVAKMMPGENAPPMHPHCRCSTAAYSDRKEYEEWLDFLDKGGTTEEFEKQKTAKLNDLLTNAVQKNDTMQVKTNPPVQIGGVDVFVTNSQYGFGDGRGGVKKTVDAVIYQAPDGTKFVFPKKYDKAKQSITPEKAILLWQNVPQSIRNQAQKTIAFVDYYNPQDAIWRKRYKNFGHSFATGGDTITFYRCDVPQPDNFIIHTYCHEAGYLIDKKHSTGSTRFSQSVSWQKAMSDDMTINGKKSVSTYGENSPLEDFAESVAEYVKDKTVFSKEYPNRSALLGGTIQL